MQTKGGIRKRPQRRRGTLPVLNPPAVTLQKLLYPGTPLCNLEAKDPAATLSLILDGGKNIHFGARQKRVRILVPLLVLGENLPLRPHPPLRSGDKPSSSPARLLGGARMHPRDRNRTRHATCPRRKLFTPLRSEVQSLQAKDLQGTS